MICGHALLPPPFTYPLPSALFMLLEMKVFFRAQVSMEAQSAEGGLTDYEHQLKRMIFQSNSRHYCSAPEHGL